MRERVRKRLLDDLTAIVIRCMWHNAFAPKWEAIQVQNEVLPLAQATWDALKKDLQIAA